MPVPFTALPRAVHIAQHLTVMPATGLTTHNGDIQRLFASLIEPGTLNDVARRLHWSRRMVEYATVRYIEPVMPCEAIPANGNALALRRLEWLRIAYSIDPCWCERLW